MKNNKLLIVLSFILLVSVVFCNVVYTSVDNKQAVVIKKDQHIIRSGAVITKNFTNSYGFERKLTYSKTQTQTNDNYVDIYVDEMFEEYRFDKNQNLLGICDDDAISRLLAQTSNGTDIGEQKAIEIATDYLKKLYGKTFDEFKHCESWSSDNIYVIHFLQKSGKDNRITVSRCGVFVQATGEVIYSYMPIWSTLDMVDTNKLTEIDVKTLVDHAKKQAKEAYGDELVSFKLDGLVGPYITETKNGLAIAVPAIIEVKEDLNGIIETFEQTREFYYEI